MSAPANFAIFRLDRYGYPHFVDNRFRTREECKQDVRAMAPVYTNAISEGEPKALIIADLAWYKRNQDPDEKSEKELRRLYNEPEERGPVVVSGTIEGVSRAQAKSTLESLGFRVAGAVSGKTFALIAGKSAGGKKTKAEQLGIPVFTWESFLAQNSPALENQV